MDPTLLIGDIVERDSTDKKPVEFSDQPISSTGFPQHKRRWKTSAFKQRRGAEAANETQPQGQSEAQTAQGSTENTDFEAVEKERIDRENRQKLASMSPAEIAQAQEDLMNGMNPALIQKLLQRANIDEPTGPSPFDIAPSEPAQASAPPPEIKIEDTTKTTLPTSTPTASSQGETRSKESSSESARSKLPAASSKKIADDYNEDQAPAQIPADLFPITDQPASFHFPVAPALPDLDPSDPNFMATLHEKYFPDLPADPSKLAWMAPVPTEDSPADQDSSYYPHPEIAVSALRFDFLGRFLSPRVSRSIPSSKGLHHHGEAPEAAGYTIAELAHLARSAFPAQRCMAFQTLGRILYRLGHGEWGKTADDPIAMGIWAAVKKGRVLQTLTEAAMGEGGHRGSRAYSTEALWLFEKGGWREKFKGR
ncbi:hypothetical protein FZEAL_3159 [Fusarium zealandicum]|uniref:Transcription factor Rba50 n=1 Tax=Fusarium zealandicum TaxID=1053134 RepID=A0A8H4UPD6_9HYPO|nr:hypothetical protein FZEAL_3159 [Fusarium zealandicum]